MLFRVYGLNLGEMSLCVKAEQAKCSRSNGNLPFWMFITVDEQGNVLALLILLSQKLSCDSVAKGGFKWDLSDQFSEILGAGVSCPSPQTLKHHVLLVVFDFSHMPYFYSSKGNK